jgi:hypothetical protein
MNTDAAGAVGPFRSLVLPAAFTVGAIRLLLPFDGVISERLAHVHLGPDLHTELKMLQQYGQFSATVMVMAVIWLLDPDRRKRLLDWGAAIGAASLSCFALKILIGRPRPKFADSLTFAGIWHAYPFPSREDGAVFRYSWDLAGNHAWDLWSMPSSHTALAAVMSVFLCALYPKLRPFCVTMVVIVGSCRVLFHDHYPSDVAVGAVVGYVLAQRVIQAGWGVRLLDWIVTRSKFTKSRAPEASFADGAD